MTHRIDTSTLPASIADAITDALDADRGADLYTQPRHWPTHPGSADAVVFGYPVTPGAAHVDLIGA